MDKITAILTLLFLLFLAGCSSVVSLHPVGKERMALEPGEWDGTWLADENAVTMKVIDRDKGVVQMAWIEEVGNELRPKFVVFQVFKGGKWRYANVLELEGKKADEAYYWGMMQKEQGRIVFFSPSVAAFARAAESGKIKAVIKKSKSSTAGEVPSEKGTPDSVQVTLTDTPEAVVQLVEDGGNDYFDLERPLIFVRLFHK